MQIFGFEILKKKQEELKSVVQPDNDDGAVNLSSNAAAYYSQVVDMDTNIKNENELIKRYREISLFPEVDEAITEIVNEAISYDEDHESVKLDLSKLKLSDSIKAKINDEFHTVLELLNFKEKGYEIFHKWYVDGRLYYLINLDPQSPRKVFSLCRRLMPEKSEKLEILKKVLIRKLV